MAGPEPSNQSLSASDLNQYLPQNSQFQPQQRQLSVPSQQSRFQPPQTQNPGGPFWQNQSVDPLNMSISSNQLPTGASSHTPTRSQQMPFVQQQQSVNAGFGQQ